MKLLNMAILGTALCFPLSGCGGAPSGDNEAPTDVSDAPDASAIESALEAPALDANDQDSKPPSDP
jgi:hypothetical protein